MAYFKLNKESSLKETFFDWLDRKGLYQDYNGMHTYILEYEAGYPDMSSLVYEKYRDKCRIIVKQFKEDV